MADVLIDKKLKLANTRKRFKELQELKKKRNEGQNQQITSETTEINSTESSSRNTPVAGEKHAQKICFNDNAVNTGAVNNKGAPIEPQVGNSIQDLFFNNSTDLRSNNDKSPAALSTNVIQQDIAENMPHNVTNIQENRSESTVSESATSTLPNYFNVSNDETPAAFFDNIPPNEPENSNGTESPSLTYFNTSEGGLHGNPSENIGLPRYFDNINSSSTIWENTVPENRETFSEDYALFPKREESNYKNLNQHTTSDDDVLSQDDPEIKQNEIKEYASKRPENLVASEQARKKPDVLSQDDPEIKQNEIREHASKRPENLVASEQVRKKPENLVASEQVRKRPENLVASGTGVDRYSEKSLENIFSPSDTEKLMDYLGTTGATEEEKVAVVETKEEIDNFTDLAKREILHSNSESLRQLSDQLAHMIEPNYEYSSSGSITDLEKRNIELAANLEREKLNSDQLRAISLDQNARIAQLEAELVQREVGSNLHNAQEVAQLKNELQAHLQTVGLLVAEKTELSSNLSQYELNSKQKIAECEELQARLKASRGRVADLEREVNNLKSEKSKTESMGEYYNVTLESLRYEYGLLKEQKDELAQDLLEVREKLKNTLDDNVKLQEENKDLAGKLSLADIKIQQLSSGGTLEVDSQIEQLMQEKFSLESEVSNLNQMLKTIIRERDESTVQYQQYAQQLNAQTTNLSSKLEQIQQEKENLLTQEQNRIKHIGELERQLQNIQNDQVSYVTRNSSNSELKNELENFRELCVQMQIEKTTAEENYTKVSNEKDLLLKELEAKMDSISQLESMVEQLRGNQPDSVKLLATMESDKVAASRAIQQNRELKQQLESMQEVFMKMDNDKVILTENLKGQQQTNKDLIEKLQKTELTLQSLADAIEIKDKELTHLRTTSLDMNRQALHHEQLEDRLRHYEAHDNSAHILQHELQESKQTIVKLTSELNKKKDEDNRESHRENGALEGDLQEARRKIVELTNEVNKQNVSSGSNFTDGVAESQEKLDNSGIEQAEEVEDEIDRKLVDVDRNKNILDKENAMRYLEEKVKRTMQEIADLSDEKQRLEHIVLQLQSETETIGEYVALYQHQRMVLKQKALEKDQQLKQLANDREQIKVKLDRLNELIKKLVTEKGAVPAELIQHQESMNSQFNNFCEEHSKMNDEITKIKQNQSNVIEPDSEKEYKETSQTAEEIITLLSEIKTSNLVQPDENFHHCPWCSGQLIVV